MLDFEEPILFVLYVFVPWEMSEEKLILSEACLVYDLEKNIYLLPKLINVNSSKFLQMYPMSSVIFAHLGLYCSTDCGGLDFEKENTIQ